MNILVIGAEGQVGTFFLRELSGRHAVSGTSVLQGQGLPVLDIRDRMAVAHHLRTVQPQQVILTAALTHVDKCETAPQEAQAINVAGTRNVAMACRDIGAGLTFFSTDYVFDGQHGPYAETDTPNPKSVYARTKWEGEQIVAELVPRHLIVRPMFVFSYLENSMNFFMQVMGRVQKHEPITAPMDQLGNPTQAVNLARAVGELIENNCVGVYHTAGTTRVSKADFARKIVEKLGGDPGVVRGVTTAELKQPALRPLNSGLRVDKAQAVLKASRFWDLDTALDFSLEQARLAAAGAHGRA